MINQPEHKPGTASWALSLGRLVDRLLDHVERLGRLVLPAAADVPAYGDVKVEARFDRFVR